MISTEEERGLLNKVKLGDRASFEKLESLNRNKVKLHVLKILKDESESKEIYQRGLIKAWQKIQNFRGDCRFSTWLCKICHNIALDEYKKKDRRILVSYNQLLESSPSIEADLQEIRRSKTGFENLQIKELGARLSKTFDELPAKHRQILSMLTIENMTYKAIASKLNLSMGTAMSKIFHARKKAQKIYNEIERKEGYV